MYACVLETGRGFFEGVCRRGDRPIDSQNTSPDSRIAAITEATYRLDELRRNWLNLEGASKAELKKCTLTNFYSARPTWLENAHARLGAAVFASYGWPLDTTDEEVLQNLLALN